MNIAAAIAKLLYKTLNEQQGNHANRSTNLCDFLSPKVHPRMNATAIETTVVITKNMGMIHSSRSFAVRDEDRQGLRPCI